MATRDFNHIMNFQDWTQWHQSSMPTIQNITCKFFGGSMITSQTPGTISQTRETISQTWGCREQYPPREPTEYASHQSGAIMHTTRFSIKNAAGWSRSEKNTSPLSQINLISFSYYYLPIYTYRSNHTPQRLIFMPVNGLSVF